MKSKISWSIFGKDIKNWASLTKLKRELKRVKFTLIFPQESFVRRFRVLSYAIYWTIAFRSISRIFTCLCLTSRRKSCLVERQIEFTRVRIQDAISWVLCIQRFFAYTVHWRFLLHDIPQREIKSYLDRDTTERSSFGGFTVAIIPINRVRLFSLGLNYELKCHLRTSSRGAVFEPYYIQVRR